MRKNELGLKFHAEKMYQDLIWEFIKTIDLVSDELADQMKSRTDTPVVSESIKKHIVWEGFDYIETLVGSDHWKAFLDNYGTGSKMASEVDNPYLSEYKQKYWNSERNSSAIIGRASGTYEVPDWESGDGYVTRKSSGSLKGVNLEKISIGNKQGQFNLLIKPKPPTFFVENSMKFIKKVFEDKLLEVYNNFPFYNYLEGGI